tara:strand:+ start:3613 stop:4218 length:606 start_codon:yes stop_codon:yes gene_type:complete
MNLSDPNFFYEEMTSAIGNKILSLLRNSVKQHEDNIDWIYPIEISDEFFEVNWSYRVQRINQKDNLGWDIYAQAGLNSMCVPSIDIVLFVEKGKWIKRHEISKSELFGVIAHELHHIAQHDGVLSKLRKADMEAACTYFLDPAECEAFLIGFRAQSHYSGKQVADCMSEYLSPRVDQGYLTQLQKDKIINTWLTVKWCDIQ